MGHTFTVGSYCTLAGGALSLVRNAVEALGD